MNIRTTSITVIIAFNAVVLAMLGYGAYRFLTPRVVARAVTPDRIEMRVLQRFNWSGEPFTTSFVYHRPGEPWRSHYYDHQDTYWGHARVSLDTNAKTAIFYRREIPSITFAWDRGIYTAPRISRDEHDAHPKPDGWSPEKEGFR